MPTPLYLLSPQAAKHVEDILAQIADYSGEERSRRTENLLYATFNSIAAQPGVGHLRPDLIVAPVYFFYVKPYQLLYRKDIPIQIVAVFHGARDIAALGLSNI